MMPELPSFMVRGEDGEEYGPVALEEMRDWVQENRAGIGTQVRRDEPGATWQLFQEFPELVALAAEATAIALPGLAPAPMGRRVLAFGADLVLFYILCTPIAAVLVAYLSPDWYAQVLQVFNHPPPYFMPEVSEKTSTLSAPVVPLVFGLYFAGFIALHGKTPAMQILRLRVVDQDGNKPDLAKSVVRAFVHTLSFVLILSVVFSFIPIFFYFFSPQRRTLHDFVAGTYVVEA